MEGIQVKTTGLTLSDRINTPVVATNLPAGSDSGCACAEGLEPWYSKGLLEECVPWHCHCMFHQSCSCKANTNQGYWRLLPNSIPFLALASLPGVMLPAQHSHLDSYLACGNTVNANSCFLFIRNRAVTEQPHMWWQTLMKSDSTIPSDMFKLQSLLGM